MRSYDKLIELKKERGIYQSLTSLAHWDMEVMMSSDEQFYREKEMELLASKEHSILASDEYGKLIQQAEDENLSEDEKINLREIRWEHTRKSRIPDEIMRQMSSLPVKNMPVWLKAREEKKFDVFKENFEKIFNLYKKAATHINPDKEPYCVLLEEYDRSFTKDELTSMFNRIKDEVIPLVKKNRSEKRKIANISDDNMISMCQEILKKIGYDFSKGRLDLSAHPMTDYHGRITTRLDGFPKPLLSTIHEAGHAFYEMNLPREHFGTPLGTFANMSVHESQS